MPGWDPPITPARVGCREGVQTGEGEIMKELPSECQFFKKILNIHINTCNVSELLANSWDTPNSLGIWG